MFERFNSQVAWVIFVVIVVWLLYLSIKVAQHVNAWPFG